MIQLQVCFCLLGLALAALVCVIAYAVVSRVRMRRRARLERADGPTAVLSQSTGAAVASTAVSPGRKNPSSRSRER